MQLLYALSLGFVALTAPACIELPNTLSTVCRTEASEIEPRRKGIACARTQPVAKKAGRCARHAHKKDTVVRTNAIDRLDTTIARRIHGGVQHVHVQRPYDHHDDAAALGSTGAQSQGGPAQPSCGAGRVRAALTDAFCLRR